MKQARTIYEEAKQESLNDGNQSLEIIAINAIEKGQQDLFRFLCDEAQKDEYKDLPLKDYFDLMDMELIFI